MKIKRILDLFCGAGGAAMGWHRAFSEAEIVGVDMRAQKNYPFTFVLGDALEYLREHGHEFDFIHASPPCQRYSKSVKKINRDNHPDLVEPTRLLLKQIGKPYVIENVPGAPLINPFILCGSMFDLPVRRHRQFESSLFFLAPSCRHEDYPAIYPPAWNRKNPLRVLSISGGYQTRKTMGENFMNIHKAAMGIDWEITYAELSQAIPPAYSEWIGNELKKILKEE